MSPKIKSSVLDFWDFFPKMVWGLSIMEIRLQEIKPSENIYEEKSPKFCENEIKSIKMSHKKRLFYASVFRI